MAVHIMVLNVKATIKGSSVYNDISSAIEAEVLESLKLLEADSYGTHARYSPALAWLPRVAEPLHPTAAFSPDCKPTVDASTSMSRD
eukprot:jgi/Chlat1/1867/Chrsp141S02194